MLEDREKKMIYVVIGIIIALLLVVLVIIWLPMFKSNDSEVDITFANQYEKDYYSKMMKEKYKQVISECVNKDNFNDTYQKLDKQYLEDMNMSEKELEAYLNANGILTYSSSSAVIYCSLVRSDGEKYIYTYVYKIGGTERKVHIIEKYIGNYTISFSQDSYPVVDSNVYYLKDNNTNLEFEINKVKCFDENMVLEVNIINKTTEEFKFKFYNVDDSNLIYNSDETNKKALLSSLIIGTESSELTSVPGSTNKIKLSYGININNQENINYIVFNNVTMTNGENTNIELIIK